MGIETKLDQYDEAHITFQALAIAERNAADIRELNARLAKTTATALAAKTTRNDIQETKYSLKWAHRTVVATVVGMMANIVYTTLQSS